MKAKIKDVDKVIYVFIAIIIAVCIKMLNHMNFIDWYFLLIVVAYMLKYVRLKRN